MRTIAAMPAIALLGGCACGLRLDHLPRFPAYSCLVASGALAIWTLRAGRTRLLALAVTVGFFGGGAVLSYDAWERARRPPLRAAFERLAVDQRAAAERSGRRLPQDDEAAAVLTGVLTADAAPGANGVSLVVDVIDVEEQDPRPRQVPRQGQKGIRGGVRLTVLGSLAADRVDRWRAGRTVRLPVQLRRPARYLDPGVPDGERALALRGITLVGTAKSGALVDVVTDGPWWAEAVAAARAFARRALADGVARWSPQSGAIVAAIVIGDRSTLDDALQNRLQEAGTYHVIAISGGNIAILAGLIVGGFRVAGRFGRLATSSAIAILIVYAALVGGGASVNRATLMAVLYFMARLFDQRSAPVNTLAVAAALLGASNPLSVVDPAFLLTVGATMAILVIVPAFDCTGLPYPFAAPATLFLASAAAELCLFPIAASLFSRVTFAGLVLNFIAIPLMSVAQIAGMAVVPLALVSSRVAALAGWVAHQSARGLVLSADLVQFAPMVAWRVAPPLTAVCAVYYACGATAWAAWRRRRELAGSAEGRAARIVRRTATVGAVLAAVWILIDPRTLTAAAGDGRLHATFIDVGQGDAAFIVFPHGSTLLIDAGGLGFAASFDIGNRVVAPVVRSLGFRRIDRLALTHGDPDHIGGAPAIVREFLPAEIWEGIPVARSDVLTALRVQAQRQGARWSNVHAGDHVTIDGVAVRAMHPEPEEWERQKVRNDDSLVLELRWRDVSIVLTGDIGRIPERRLESRFADSPIRVVKVPHHGSLSSSSVRFLDALKPTVAVVSVGRSNHFGHPAPEVLERYVLAGARVFRTDRDGAVTADTDGRSLVITTFAERRSTCFWPSPTRFQAPPATSPADCGRRPGSAAPWP